MIEIINKYDLFCDEYRAVTLCEYTRDLSLIKRLICIAEDAVRKMSPQNTWCYEGVCYMFARSIVSYSKMAYDNMLLGHFDATHMLIRTIIENNVCLDVILDKEIELWKYYMVQSYRNTIIKPGKNPPQKDIDFIEQMYIDYGIEKEFTEKRGDKKAYIDRDYGWTYKINKSLTFAGLCESVDKHDYADFKMMSEYTHGTSIHLKISGSVSMDHIMSMISSLYIGLYRMMTMFCDDCWTEEFNDVTEEIEGIIYDYIEDFESTMS